MQNRQDHGLRVVRVGHAGDAYQLTLLQGSRRFTVELTREQAAALARSFAAAVPAGLPDEERWLDPQIM